ncbi:MAG TPA: rhodanese-like domain-containing protein [Steroidobacteraceae bacterium]|nr:rhodanese-like domain-containing protein [Steroidobacteraceae bacterium]
MNRRVVGFLFATLVSAGALAADPALVPVSQEALLERQQNGKESTYVLDVRSPEEYASGHVPGAVNIPYDQMASRIAEVPKDKDVVLYCRTGRRAGIAAEVLAGQGYTRLQHLEGDIVAWVEKGRPVATPLDPSACVAALTAGQPAQRACAAP